MVDAFFQPARASILPTIVPPDRLVRANGLLSAVSRTCLAGGTVRASIRIGWLFAGLAVWVAAGMVLLAVAKNLVVAIAIGSGTGFQAVFGLSWLQRAIEPRVLGRVMSVEMVAGYATVPISLLVTGALGQDHLGLLFLGTAALLAITAVAVLSSATVRTM